MELVFLLIFLDLEPIFYFSKDTIYFFTFILRERIYCVTGIDVDFKISIMLDLHLIFESFNFNDFQCFEILTIFNFYFKNV